LAQLIAWKSTNLPVIVDMYNTIALMRLLLVWMQVEYCCLVLFGVEPRHSAEQQYTVVIFS
jgi:hypothetical protein